MESQLSKIIPNKGIYFVAAKEPNRFPHYLCCTIEEMALKASEIDAQGYDAFFACASFKQESYIDAKGKRRQRTSENAGWAKSFWIDIDCSAKKAEAGLGYLDVETATAALDDFVHKTGLPSPMIIHSGGGLHVYWPLAEDIEAEQWVEVANRLKALTQAQETRLIVDQSRTTDLASILRPIGTHNWKPDYDGPEVMLAERGEVNSFDDFKRTIDVACFNVGCLVAPSGIVKGMALLKAMGGGLGGYDIPDRIEEGERNTAVLSYVGHLRGTGVSEDLIPGMALDFNRSRCSSPLNDDEVLSIASRYEEKAITPGVEVGPDEWPEPEKIQATLPWVPQFDQRLLPKVFRAWVSDIADRMQCPIEFLAVGAIVAAGAAVGNRVGVQPKQHDTGWVEVPNLWGAVVGRPGVMKSPALAQVLSPLRQLESAALSNFTATQAQYEIDKMKYGADMKNIEAQIKKGAIILPGQLPVLPVEPQPQRYLVNDSTYQKLGAVLSGNPHGLLVFQDELSGLLMRLDTSGQESSRAFYLEAWDGKQDYTFDRMERGTVRIPRLCFSLLGGLQPSKLREYLRSAVYGGKGDDGLAQRLQMLVYPDIALKWKQVDRLPDLIAATAADAVFKRLATLDPIALGARQHYPDSIPVFGFTEDAQALFNSWWSELENSLRSGERHPALESHVSKYRKLVPALALLIHLIQGNTGDISIDSLRRAIGWQKFLFVHAVRAYAAVTSATMDTAKSLSRHIKRGALNDGFTVRDIYRKGWSLLSTAKEATEAVGVLVDLGWLRAEQDKRFNGTDGRPTVRYYINPRLQAAA
jgi:hypothetical protein